MDGDGDGDRDGDAIDGTTSGDGIDSTRVNAALLAGESQHTRQTRRRRNGDLPVSPRPPIQLGERPYGHVRRWCQRGRIKFESAKVSQTLKVSEMTYLERASAVQPCGNAPNCVHRVHRPRRQHGRIKFIPRKINRMETDGNAHLGRVNAIQPVWRPGERIRRVSKPTFECRTPGEPWREDGRPEIERISVNQAGEDEVTYRGRA